MSHVVALVLGLVGLAAAWFLWLVARAPLDTDIWPGGEPRRGRPEDEEGRGPIVVNRREPW